MDSWLRNIKGPLDPGETAFSDSLATFLDELHLPALDTEASEAVKDENGVHISLAHHRRGRIVEIEAVGEIVVSYGVEHDHFYAGDAEVGRVWPFQRHLDRGIVEGMPAVRGAQDVDDSSPNRCSNAALPIDLPTRRNPC